MSTDIARVENNRDAVGGLTADQVALIKRTIAKDATDDELALFITQANRTQLDPFNRQIWFTKRQGKVQIITGIDGYRLIGERTGRRMGSKKFWCGDDAVWREVWLSKERPAAAKAIVRVLAPNGETVEYDGIALWSEYGEKADGFMWPKMPAAQLGKCAEALAYRAAFPAECAGIYVAEEMDQAGPPARPHFDPRPEAVEALVKAQQSPPRPADPTTGEVIETRTKRRPPNNVPAARAAVPADVRARLIADVEALGALGTVWIDKEAAARGIPNILTAAFTPGDVKVVEALVKTARTMDVESTGDDKEPF